MISMTRGVSGNSGAALPAFIEVAAAKHSGVSHHGWLYLQRITVTASKHVIGWHGLYLKELRDPEADSSEDCREETPQPSHLERCLDYSFELVLELTKMISHADDCSVVMKMGTE